MHPKAQWQFLKRYGQPAKWLHPSEVQATLWWAAVVGALGGLSAIAFRAAIQGMLWSWTRHTGSFEQVAAELAWWQRLLIPAAGGLLAGLILHFGARFGRGRRSTDYMEAVAVHPGAIAVRSSLAKTASSLFTIGSGGSVGREGAMVQLSALIASWLGERIGLSTPRLRLIIACGAAGGIAGVYNVPVGGALFVADIVLGSIAVESIGPLLVASLASAFVSRYVGGTESYFTSSHFQLASPWELFPFLAMAVLLGVAAPGYVWFLRRSEDWLTRLVPSVPWRLACGGLIVGALAIPFPEVWGNGHTMVNRVLSNPWPWAMLAMILVGKVMATAATTGSGAVGGVFTPTLFTGAMLGSLFGHAVAALPPHATAGAEYALVGMGGFLAAATRAPLMAILMLFEMTQDYGIILPLMGVCVVSYYIARSLQSDSIYSESLRRKQPRATPAEISALRVGDLMKPSASVVTENTPFAEIAKLFASTPYRHALVVTLQSQLRGVITLEEIERRLQGKEPTDWTTAADLMRVDLPLVTSETSLSAALEMYRDYRGERLPVVNDLEQRTLLGDITKTDLLLALAHGLKGSTH